MAALNKEAKDEIMNEDEQVADLDRELNELP